MLSKIRRWHHESVVSYTQVVVMQVFFSIVSHLGKGKFCFGKLSNCLVLAGTRVRFLALYQPQACMTGHWQGSVPNFLVDDANVSNNLYQPLSLEIVYS